MHVTPFDIVRPLCSSDQQALSMLAADSSDFRFAEFRDDPHKKYEYNDLLSLKNSAARACGIFAIAAKQLLQRKECKDDVSLQLLREKIRHYLNNSSIEKKSDVLKYIQTPDEWFFITDNLDLDPKSPPTDKDFIAQYTGVIFAVAQHVILPGSKCSSSAIDHNTRMLKQLAASNHAGNAAKVNLLLELQNTNNMWQVLDCFVAAFEKDRNVKVGSFWNKVMTTTVLKNLFADIADLPDVNKRDRYLLVLTYFLMRHSGKSKDNISPDVCKCNPVVFACAQQLVLFNELRPNNVKMAEQVTHLEDEVAAMMSMRSEQQSVLRVRIVSEVVDDEVKDKLLQEIPEVGMMHVKEIELIDVDVPTFPNASWDKYQSSLLSLTSKEDGLRQELEVYFAQLQDDQERFIGVDEKLNILKIEYDKHMALQKAAVEEQIVHLRAEVKVEFSDLTDDEVDSKLRGQLQQRIQELSAKHTELFESNEALRGELEKIESERLNYGPIAERPTYYFDEKFEFSFSSDDVYCLCSFANKMAKIVEACGSNYDGLLQQEQIWKSKVEECSREAADLKSGITDLRRQAQEEIEINSKFGERLDMKVDALPKNASEQYMMKGIWSDKLPSIGSIESHDTKKTKDLERIRDNLPKLVGDLCEHNVKFKEALGDVGAVAKSIIDRQESLQSAICYFSDTVMQGEQGGLNKLMTELLRSRHKQQNFSRLRFRKFDYSKVAAVTAAVDAIVARGYKKSLPARVLRLPFGGGKAQKQQQILQALQVVNSVTDVFAKLELKNLSYDDKALSLASIFGACHSLGAQLDAIKLLPQHDEIVVVFKKYVGDLEEKLKQLNASDVAVETARMKIFTRDKTVSGDSSKYILQCCGAECRSSQCDSSAAQKTSFAILQLPGVEDSSSMQVAAPSVEEESSIAAQKAGESRASSCSVGGIPSIVPSSVFEGETFLPQF